MRFGPGCWAAFAAVMLAACGSSPITETSARAASLRLATGPAGGGFYPFGRALADQFATTPDALQLIVESTGGAVANVKALQRGDTDLGFVFADVAYLAQVGRLEEESNAFDRIRAVAVLQLSPVHLLTTPTAGVKSVTDLRGKRVVMGPVDSGTAFTARLILEAFGVAFGDVHAEFMQFSDAGALLVRHRIDAMFDNAIYADAVADAVGAGAQLVAIDGPSVDRLRNAYPFLRVTAIPGGTYANVPATATVGVDSVLICRRGLDEQTVHTLTSRLFEALPRLAPSMRRNLAALDEASATPIPLHEGAARYYREQELLR